MSNFLTPIPPTPPKNKKHKVIIKEVEDDTEGSLFWVYFIFAIFFIICAFIYFYFC